MRCDFCEQCINDPKKNQVRCRECTSKYQRDFVYMVYVRKISKADAVDKIQHKIRMEQIDN